VKIPNIFILVPKPPQPASASYQAGTTSYRTGQGASQSKPSPVALGAAPSSSDSFGPWL